MTDDEILVAVFRRILTDREDYTFVGVSYNEANLGQPTVSLDGHWNITTEEADALTRARTRTRGAV